MLLLARVSNLRKTLSYTAASFLLITAFLHLRTWLDDAPAGAFKLNDFSEATASVAKVSVVYGDRDTDYKYAIETHKQHADRHHYPLYILRKALVDGYWNKLLFLLHIIVQELGKNTADRVEWLMWFDADSMIINPEIPLEIFLPPVDFSDVHVLTGKDHNGLNTGIFFLRVHRWSIEFLVRVLGWPVFKPEVDLGYSADQTAMAMVLNESEYSDHVVYQPRIWYNAYMSNDGFEGEPGAVLVHFPGLDDRFTKMHEWWQVLSDEGEAANWTVPVTKTDYPQKIEKFWQTLKNGRTMVKLAEERMQMNVKAGIVEDSRISTELSRLRFAISQESDLDLAVETAMERMQMLLAEDLGIGEVTLSAKAKL